MANAIIPKWQIGARHIVESTILQRQWRRHREERNASKATTTSVTQKQDVVEKHEEVVSPLRDEQPVTTTITTTTTTSQFVGGTISGEDRVMRFRLTIAVAACILYLGMQLCIGVALLLQSIQGLPLGLIFLVACVVYIAYLLQSVGIL